MQPASTPQSSHLKNTSWQEASSNSRTRAHLVSIAAVVCALLPALSAFGQSADPIASLSQVRFFLNWQEWSARGFTGKNVVIANIDAGHPIDHKAFNGKVDLRIAWPFSIRGRGPTSVINRNISSMHATAATGAMIADGQVGPLNLIGIAPEARVISASVASGLDPITGGLADLGLTSMSFALLAVLDQDFANQIADTLGVKRWQTATVVNLPITTVGGQDGQQALAEAVNMAASQFGATIVAPAGDLGDADFFQQNMMGQVFTGTVGEPASAFNAISVGRTGANFTSMVPESGKGPNVTSDWEPTLDDKGTDGLMDCTPRTMTLVAMQRPGPHLTAPGTRISLPGSPVIPATAPGATSTLFDFWQGTSFASSLVAGAAALVHDAGIQFGLLINDLVTKAVLLNSANSELVNADIMGTPQTGGAKLGEDNALIFGMPFNAEQGMGTLDLKRLFNQYIGPVVDPFNTGYADILPSDGIFQTGEVSTGSDFVTPGLPDAVSEIQTRTPCLAFVDCGTFALKPIDIDALFSTGRLPSRECPIAGKTRDDCQIGFATKFEAPGAETLGGTLIQPIPIGGEDDPSHAFFARSVPAMPPVGQRRGLRAIHNFNDLENTDLIHDAFSAQADPSVNGQPDPKLFGGNRASGGGGSRNGDGSTRVQVQDAPLVGGTPRFDCAGLAGCGQDFVRTGWDYGSLLTGQLDMPIGFVPDSADITVTLVWERDQRWDVESIEQNFLSALVAPQPLSSGFIPPRILMSNPVFLTGGGFPFPVDTSLQYASPTTRMRYDNLDLELWKASAGDGSRNELIARSNSTWSNIEHVVIKSQGGAQQITAGFYFIRIIFQGTLYDLGGYFHSDAFQPGCKSLHGLGFDDMKTGNTDYAVAWYVEAPSPPFGANLGLGGTDGILGLAPVTPGDANGDGFVNSSDLNMILGAVGSTNPSMDFNFDGKITAADVAIVLQNFGTVNKGVRRIQKLDKKAARVRKKIAHAKDAIAAVQRDIVALNLSTSTPDKKAAKRLTSLQKKMAKKERARDRFSRQLQGIETQLGRLIEGPQPAVSRTPRLFAPTNP